MQHHDLLGCFWWLWAIILHMFGSRDRERMQRNVFLAVFGGFGLLFSLFWGSRNRELQLTHHGEESMLVQ